MLSGCKEAASNPTDAIVIPPVKVLAIESTATQSSDGFLAQIDATQRAQLSFQVAGQVASMDVRMGQRVQRGEVLATLDASDLQYALDAAQASFELAQNEWQRTQSLYQKNLVSTDVYEQTETRYKAEKAHFQQAQTELGYTRLRAPFDGIVSSTFAKPYQVVGAKQQILNIIDNHQLDVSFTLPVSYVERADFQTLPNKKMWFTLDSDPTTPIYGVLKEISTKPNSDTNSYQAILTIERPAERNLLSGMTGQVHVARDVEQIGTVLPKSAWVSRQAESGVIWTLDPTTHRVSAKTVSLNQQGRVISGLANDALVVVAGVESLVEGQQVKVWRREEGI
ncbi:efflux RND transporter periplasmic adaptor subunit [Vibrio sp. SM6]|uniref:Efflux RND transporter periplasmic adaptor subunit n=1 Tax=Vibrio agarilyticus TaxID=2726741 RepID=A0A7X8YGR6_9VIBR|nr:efflux RND transporter periplasmic adaptor subunit [Vibrio agarilyticus]NLS13298.1 efflux RND transporter periplasmic adaptor subunit [Vibrio agarilyticus]